MEKPPQVVPAILTDDRQALAKMVTQAEGFTDYVQFDMMDGQFVPSKSITTAHLAGLQIRLSWEAHIMVLHPEGYLEGLRKARAKKVTFHYEATPSPKEVISKARRLGLGVGLAVNPETPVSAVLPLASEVGSLLFLTVHPGFYGSKFQPEVLNKVRQFRDAKPDIETGVDGGIKADNIIEVARTGLDVIYVGSAIFLQPEPAASFRRLQSLAQEGGHR